MRPASTAADGRRLGRPRQPDVDQRVVRAVLAVLARDGYGALHVDDIAAEAGIAKTTLYRRWPSKEALVAAAVGELYLDRVQEVDHGDLRSDLADLLRDTFELLFLGPGRVLEALVRQSGGRQELIEVVTSTNEPRRRAFHQAMNRGVARGELDPSAPHDLVIDLLVGPLWTRLLVTGGRLSSQDIDTIVDSVLDGVRPPSTP